MRSTRDPSPAARPEDPITTHFEEPGSLAPPRAVGRVVRLALGVWLLSICYSILNGAPGLTGTRAPAHWTFWLAVVIAFHLTPYVVNIGLTRNWKRKPQYAVVLLTVVALVLDLVMFGTWWAPPLGGLILTWLSYLFGHLGVSFLLAGLIATTGCEMRALPHLWTVITGRRTREHYCPGPLDRLDRWERDRSRT